MRHNDEATRTMGVVGSTKLKTPKSLPPLPSLPEKHNDVATRQRWQREDYQRRPNREAKVKVVEVARILAMATDPYSVGTARVIPGQKELQHDARECPNHVQKVKKVKTVETGVTPLLRTVGRGPTAAATAASSKSRPSSAGTATSSRPKAAAFQR